MGESSILSIVIRISGVSIARDDLEGRISRPLDRFEATGATSYAQLDIFKADDDWSDTLRFLKSLNPIFRRLIAEGDIEHASLDIGLAFRDSKASMSVVVPAAIASEAGSIGMDIELSVYRSSDQ